MKALILAAGRGERLGDITLDKPKALAKVAGKELILRVFDFLKVPLIKEVAVVAGYQADKLKDFVREFLPNTKIFVNRDFKMGSVKTIESAQEYLDDDFLILNTDHIYPKRMWQKIIPSLNGITAVCDFDRKLGADDMKIKLNGNNKSVILAGIKKTLTDYDGGYIGMTYCPKALTKTYRQAMADTIKSEGANANVESILNQLIQKSMEINICDASGIGWLEVDTTSDLKLAEETIQGTKEFLV